VHLDESRDARTAVDDIEAKAGRVGMNSVVTPSVSFMAAS